MSSVKCGNFSNKYRNSTEKLHKFHLKWFPYFYAKSIFNANKFGYSELFAIYLLRKIGEKLYFVKLKRYICKFLYLFPYSGTYSLHWKLLYNPLSKQSREQSTGWKIYPKVLCIMLRKFKIAKIRIIPCMISIFPQFSFAVKNFTYEKHNIANKYKF